MTVDRASRKPAALLGHTSGHTLEMLNESLGSQNDVWYTCIVVSAGTWWVAKQTTLHKSRIANSCSIITHLSGTPHYCPITHSLVSDVFQIRVLRSSKHSRHPGGYMVHKSISIQPSSWYPIPTQHLHLLQHPITYYGRLTPSGSKLHSAFRFSQAHFSLTLTNTQPYHCTKLSLRIDRLIIRAFWCTCGDNLYRKSYTTLLEVFSVRISPWCSLSNQN